MNISKSSELKNRMRFTNNYITRVREEKVSKEKEYIKEDLY